MKPPAHNKQESKMWSLQWFVFVVFLATNLSSSVVGFGPGNEAEPVKPKRPEAITHIIDNVANEFVKRCSAQGIEMSYDDLNKDIDKCFSDSAAVFIKEVNMTLTDILIRRIHIQKSIRCGEPLTEKQKTFLSYAMLTPICGTAVHMMKECHKPEYKSLSYTFGNCFTEGERIEQKLFYALIKDSCKHNAAWIFDFLEAKVANCATPRSWALITKQGEDCRRQFGVYSRNPVNSSIVVPPIDTQAHVCNFAFTAFLDDCVANVFEAQRETTQKQIEVLLNTFPKTRVWWAGKCSSSAPSIFIWSTFIIMRILLTAFAQILTKMCPIN